MLETFDPKGFVEDQTAEIKKKIGKQRALVAVSGGVDSTTCAALVHKALGENLACVILDDAFMRKNEPEHVRTVMSKPPLEVPMSIVDVRESFLQAMKGLKDAEEKRKVFRETFYQALGETAKKENCPVLVQGTIRADIIETVGGVKTQHNVLEQIGINPMERFGFKIVEPLVTLYKDQVRMVARHLGLPTEFSERQPYPGPGLSVRVVGEIRPDKLELLKKATTIVEQELAAYKPSQYFAVIIDNDEATRLETVVRKQETVARFLNVPSRNVRVKTFSSKATGVKGGERRYGEIMGISVQSDTGSLYQTTIQNLVSLQAKLITENLELARIFFAVQELPDKKQYVIGIRSVQTKDFLTAQVSEIPWSILAKTAQQVIDQCPNVSTVYYDVTPKPPATIEME